MRPARACATAIVVKVDDRPAGQRAVTPKRQELDHAPAAQPGGGVEMIVRAELLLEHRTPLAMAMTLSRAILVYVRYRLARVLGDLPGRQPRGRSEERRVGKGWRSGRARE